MSPLFKRRAIKLVFEKSSLISIQLFAIALIVIRDLTGDSSGANSATVVSGLAETTAWFDTSGEIGVSAANSDTDEGSNEVDISDEVSEADEESETGEESEEGGASGDGLATECSTAGFSVSIGAIKSAEVGFKSLICRLEDPGCMLGRLFVETTG